MSHYFPLSTLDDAAAAALYGWGFAFDTPTGDVTTGALPSTYVAKHLLIVGFKDCCRVFTTLNDLTVDMSFTISFINLARRAEAGSVSGNEIIKKRNNMVDNQLKLGNKKNAKWINLSIKRCDNDI